MPGSLAIAEVSAMVTSWHDMTRKHPRSIQRDRPRESTRNSKSQRPRDGRRWELALLEPRSFWEPYSGAGSRISSFTLLSSGWADSALRESSYLSPRKDRIATMTTTAPICPMTLLISRSPAAHCRASTFHPLGAFRRPGPLPPDAIWSPRILRSAGRHDFERDPCRFRWLLRLRLPVAMILGSAALGWC